MKYKQICPECNKVFYLKDSGDKMMKCPECGGRDISAEKLVLMKDDNDIAGRDPKIQDMKEQPERKSAVKGDIMNFLAMAESIDRELEDVNESDNGIQTGENLELLAVGTYGTRGLKIEINAKETPALIGRSAIGGDFLNKDLRVSNEHCYVKEDGGNWYVIDNKSTNTTQVNGRQISSEVYTKITNDDQIKLGKDNDTFEFKVLIK